MRSTNPVLTGRGFARIKSDVLDRESSLETGSLESRPSAAPMSMEDVVLKTGALFAILLATGIYSWNANQPGLALIGMVVGLVLAMVITFSKKVRPVLVMAYAAAQGLALGTVSALYESAYDGIVRQAVIATACAFGGVLVAYRSGKIRVTPKFNRILSGSLLGYFVFGLITLFTGFPTGGLGLIISIGGVALASMFIVSDLDQIQQAVNAKVSHEESWRCAFGLMVTLVWLYLEVLRLISILRGRD